MKKKFTRHSLNSISSLALICLFGLASCQVKNNQSSVVIKTPIEKNKAQKPDLKASQEFVQGSEDIPLPEKVSKVFEENLGFDSESGSVMSSSYITENEIEDLKKFYRKNLTQMGWKISKNSSEKMLFKRENETLEIEFSKYNNSKNQIKFFISTSL